MVDPLASASSFITNEDKSFQSTFKPRNCRYTAWIFLVDFSFFSKSGLLLVKLEFLAIVVRFLEETVLVIMSGGLASHLKILAPSSAPIDALALARFGYEVYKDSKAWKAQRRGNEVKKSESEVSSRGRGRCENQRSKNEVFYRTGEVKQPQTVRQRRDAVVDEGPEGPVSTDTRNFCRLLTRDTSEPRSIIPIPLMSRPGTLDQLIQPISRSV